MEPSLCSVLICHPVFFRRAESGSQFRLPSLGGSLASQGLSFSLCKMNLMRLRALTLLVLSHTGIFHLSNIYLETLGFQILLDADI